MRTFRILRPLPLIAEFFAMRYVIDVYDMPWTNDAEYLMVHLPCENKDYGRELMHAGKGIVRGYLKNGFNVNSPSLSEVLFLRLARQGGVEELAGQHCLIPWKDPRLRSGHYAYAAFPG